MPDDVTTMLERIDAGDRAAAAALEPPANSAPPTPPKPAMRSQMLVILPLVLFAALPLVVGVVIIAVYSRRRSSAHPACGRCGYDISASLASSHRCPECGGTFEEVGITPPRTTGPNRNVFAIALGLVLIVCSLACLGSSALALWHAAMEP